MYNRYINSMGEDFFTQKAQDDSPPFTQETSYTNDNQTKGGIFDGIRNMFSKNENGSPSIGGLSFDLDTLFLLVLVYFLIADGEDDISETLLIVAALVLFGF